MICRNSVLSFSKHSPICLDLYSSHVSGRRRGTEIRFASTRYLRSQDSVNEPKLPRFIRRQNLQEGSSKKHTQSTNSESFPTTRYLPSQDTVNEPKLPRFIRRQNLQEGSSKKHTQNITSNTESSFSTRYFPSRNTVNEPKLPRFIRRQNLQEGSSKKHTQNITSNAESSFSTRYFPSQNTVNEPKLPRFIRRQHLQEDSSEKHVQQITSQTRAHPPSLSPRVAPTHRSRHYDPSNETPKENMRLLEPHVLSKRLKALCDSNKIDDAVSMLKNSPLDAQNTQVWNTLIWEALKAKRFKLSYQLFIDMKRRGLSPTTRTFQTFFNGLSRIEDWSIHPKQLTNARSLYDAYQRHITSLKSYDPGSLELLIDPLAGYIRILGSAGQYQEVFDVYYAMDQDGPLSPNQFIFTAMFHAIVAAKNNVSEGAAKVAADARLLWNQMNKASTRSPGFTIDSFSVVAALTALSGGNKVDHDLAFQITTNYFGLIPDKPKSANGILPLHPESFAAILKLCNQSKRHELCSQFLRQVKRRNEDAGGVSIIDRRHLEEVLRGELASEGSDVAFRALETLEWMLRQEIIGANGPKIRPALSTYVIVVQACRRDADWKSATRTFDLMTGYHSHDFMDGSVADTPRQDKRGPGRSFPPNAEFMSWMVQTALTTKNHANIRQSLRMVDYLGFENILNVEGAGESKNTAKILKNKAFFGSKFSSAITEATEFISDKRAKPHEAEKDIPIPSEI